MTRLLRGSSAVLLVTLALLAVSCGSEAIVVPTASSTAGVAGEGGTTVEAGTTADAVPWWQATRGPAEFLEGPDVTAYYTTETFDLVLALAQAVVAGEVLSVQGPFWNEADGQYWEEKPGDMEDPGDMTIPELYREVAFRVDSVILDETSTLGPGAEITLLVTGGGQGTPRVGMRAWEGAVMQPGDEQVLLLAYMGSSFRENWVDAWQPLYPPVSVLDHVDGRYRPQWADQAQPGMFGLVPNLGTGQEDFSLEELTTFLDAVKAEPLGEFARLLPSNFTADWWRATFRIETTEPACLNVPRGECP